MAKFLKVGITKTLSTDLYVEVPDDFDPWSIMRASHRAELGVIAMETTDRSDWDEFEWEKTVEACEAMVVPESEASQFMVSRLRGV